MEDYTRVTPDEVRAYVQTNFPEGTGGAGYRKNLVDFLKTIVARPINSTLLLEIPSKNKKRQNYSTRRWEEIYSLDRYAFVNWKHPLGKEKGLKYGEWCLLSADPISENADRGVNKKIASQVFERDKSTCTRCGARAGQIHHLFTDKIVHLHVGHIVPFIKEGVTKKYTADDFTTLCSMCNEGEKAYVMTKEQQIEMLVKQRDRINLHILEIQGAP